jgi:formamidopyrimidine-DNA glycosylase
VPELPEVETIRRQLAERIPGRSIARVEVEDPLLVSPEDPHAFAGRVEGRRIESIGRRGKYLLVELDSGDTLAMHLRMTGRLHWRPPAREPVADADAERFLRARLDLDDGSTLTFGDMRRFGRAWIVPATLADREGYWAARVGVEPLSPRFTGRALGRLLDGRRGPIKAVLLNQALVAGLGNMYVDEALFAARIHPERPAGSLDDDEIRRLHRAIRDRLSAAVEAGGASIDSYRDSLGQRGSMQDLLRVHLRAGEPCPRCGAEIRKTRVAQRGTYWCPACQPEPEPW